MNNQMVFYLLLLTRPLTVLFKIACSYSVSNIWAVHNFYFVVVSSYNAKTARSQILNLGMAFQYKKDVGFHGNITFSIVTVNTNNAFQESHYPKTSHGSLKVQQYIICDQSELESSNLRKLFPQFYANTSIHVLKNIYVEDYVNCEGFKVNLYHNWILCEKSSWYSMFCLL